MTLVCGIFLSLPASKPSRAANDKKILNHTNHQYQKRLCAKSSLLFAKCVKGMPKVLEAWKSPWVEARAILLIIQTQTFSPAFLKAFG
jgi:uncharacterized Fe-S cluster protein YjdI